MNIEINQIINNMVDIAISKLNPNAEEFYPRGCNPNAEEFYPRGCNPNAEEFYPRGCNPNAEEFYTMEEFFDKRELFLPSLSSTNSLKCVLDGTDLDEIFEFLESDSFELLEELPLTPPPPLTPLPFESFPTNSDSSVFDFGIWIKNLD